MINKQAGVELISLGASQLEALQVGEGQKFLLTIKLQA